MPTPLTIRVARDDELPTVIENFRQMWLDLDVPGEHVRSDWRAIAEEFVARARRELDFRAFIAETDGAVAGSTACQLFGGLYPAILSPRHRKSGYIWGVHVRREYRRRGIATALTEAAVQYFRDLDCHRVLLHASPMGEPVYAAMGFAPTNERVLNLA